MIATKLAALMAATILAAGISVAPFLPGAEATAVNTTRSNIKSSSAAQQDGDVAGTNQAQGQGGQQAVPNIGQDTVAFDGDPIPGVDVKLGKNPGGLSGDGIRSEGDPTVNAEQSIASDSEQNQTVEQNGDTEDSSTNVWEG